MNYKLGMICIIYLCFYLTPITTYLNDIRLKLNFKQVKTVEYLYNLFNISLILV